MSVLDRPATTPASPATADARAGDHGRPGRALELLLPWVLVLGAAATCLLDLTVPVLRPAAGFVLLLAPVVAIARRTTWRLTSPAHAGVLALGAVVLGIIVGGLLLNTVLPLLGDPRPLAGRPVTVAVVVADVALLAWRPRVPLVRLPPVGRLRALLDLRFRPLPTLVGVTLVLTVVGAVRLNNGAGGGVAVAGHVAAIGVLVVALLGRGDDLRRDVLAVATTSASLLLATSLRSWYVSGHDVQRELISFQLVSGTGRWSMDDYQSAYHACLSVNILPTVLAELTDLSGGVVFKVVLQLLAAALPVVVLLLARSVLERRLALLAAGVFLAFPTFASDMPFLVRQEVAFLFFGLVLLVCTEKEVPLRARRVLVLVLGVGVVLSHYSTTYLTLIALVVAAAILHGLRAWHRRRGRADAGTAREPLVVLDLRVVAALVAATWLWVSPATGSGGHVLDTARESIANLVDGGGGPSSVDSAFSILPGQKTTPQERLDLFAANAVERRESRPDLDYLLPLDRAMREPTLVEADPEPLTRLGSALDGVVPVTAVNGLLRGGAAFLLQGLVLVGVAVLVIGRAGRLPGARAPDEQVRALAVGLLGGIAAVALVPGLSAEYGILRAFQQGLVLLAPVVVIGALALLTAVRPLARFATAAVGVMVVGMLLVLSGVVSATIGGSTGLLALSGQGPYVQLHYLTDGEVAGYRWLGLNAGGRVVQAEVISDKLAANRLQYHPEGGVLVASDMYPATLLRGTVVFLAADTVHDQAAAEFYTGTVVDYRFPTHRLERRLDVVFSSPDARILW